MIRRILALIHARNLEFVRDRSSFGWNLLMPLLLVFGMAFIFAGGERPLLKVAVLAPTQAELGPTLHPFLATPHIDFFRADSQARAIRQVERHQIDLLLELSADGGRYWINTEAGKGQLAERLLLANDGPPLARAAVSGAEIRYLDWLLPGILAMNMMFSAMYGVGYVIVRYRKNGYLKRLHATPLHAFEFLAAQTCSRLLVILGITSALYLGTDLLLNFRMEGSYLDLFVLAAVGAVTLICMGLLIASRVQSEELAEGLLNFITWPMILLSGVWFSLEGTNPTLQQLALIFPLTHLLDGARAIMLDGASLADILPQLSTLLLMTAIFLALGSSLFKWDRD
jgi:ABC-2 type transport system permease protein